MTIMCCFIDEASRDATGEEVVQTKVRTSRVLRRRVASDKRAFALPSVVKGLTMLPVRAAARKGDVAPAPPEVRGTREGRTREACAWFMMFNFPHMCSGIDWLA